MNLAGRRLALVALGAAMVALTVGCPLQPDIDGCTDADDCRVAFGWGSTCQPSGYCAEPSPNPRCMRTWPEDFWAAPEFYADALVIGATVSFANDDAEVLAAELAVIEANRNGGLDGREIAIVHCDYDEGAVDDGLNSADATLVVADYLVNELQVPAIIGAHSSDRTASLFSVAQDGGVLVISPSSTSPALTPLDGPVHTDDDPGLLWRTVPPDSMQARVIAADMADREIVHVGVVHQVGAYGDGLADVFEAAFLTADGRQVTVRPFASVDERNSAIAAIGADDTIDEVLFISSETPDSIDFLNIASLDETGYVDKTLFLTDAAFDSDLLELTADASDLYDRVRGTRPADLSGVEFATFTTGYFDEFGESPAAFGFSAHTYDAAWLTLYGAAWSTFQEGAVTGLGIARGLRMVSGGDRLSVQPTSWTTVVDTFREGDRIDAIGASGALDFDEQSGELSGPVEVWTIVDGGFESLYDIEL